MMKRILFLSFLSVSLFFNLAKAQVVMNEICYTNAGGQQDFWLENSDYIELYNATPGLPVNMSGYYLTDDLNNLYKWKIPSTITIPSFSFVTIWCSGRNVKEPGAAGRYHTNFDIEQCKDQWIILTRNPGVIVDSFYVRRTKPGDNWGRYTDYVAVTNQAWKLINGASIGAASFEQTNAAYPVASVYINYAPAPTFSTQAGFTAPSSGQFDMIIPAVYGGLPNDTANFQINYTQGMCGVLGGDVPCLSYTGCVGTTTSSTTYTYANGVDIIPMTGQTQVITAITVPKGTYSLSYLPSFVSTNTYFDGVDLTVSNGFGVLSVVLDTAFFRTSAATTIHVEYFDKNKFIDEAAGGVAQPPNDGWLNQQRGFDVAFDDRTGYGCNLKGKIYNDATFGVSTRTVFPNFEIRAAGVDNFSMVTPTVSTAPPPLGTHMRDAFVQTYAMKYKLNLDGMHYKPIRTFVNGCYWGMYEFREIPDEHYLEYYFDIPIDSSDILRQHVVGGIQNGSDTGWVTTPFNITSSNNKGLYNYVTYLPVQTPGGPYYKNAMSRLSKISFMDHFIYNSYLVNKDMTKRNVSWWRKRNPGTIAPISQTDTIMKWRYFMWDMNNVLGIRNTPSTYTTNVNSPMMTSPCVLTSTLLLSSYVNSTYSTTTQAYDSHSYMMYRFYQNPEFKNEYLNRYMDLLNSILRCDKMVAHFNYFRNMFNAEIPLHSAFWTVNQPDWDYNMDTLKVRIMERCTKADSLLQKCTNLNGPFTINIDVKPQGAGTVDFNSLHLSSFIWSGDYYQTKTAPYLLSYLSAWPTDTSLYVFDHWEWTATTNSTTASPSNMSTTNFLNADSLSFTIGESDNITAVFADKRVDVLFPTGFTPNGDGHNDVFLPLGAAAKYSKDYELKIWNRWGEEVFRSSDYALGWDGNFKGQFAQTGVYAYMLTYKSIEGVSKIIKGNVTLIR